MPEIVVTLGPRGGLVLAGGTAELVPAPAAATVDPTGAGDAFAAAYVVGAQRRAGAAGGGPARDGLVAGLLVGRAA